MIPLTGFSPDLPPETQGIMTECDGLLPSMNTFISAPSPIDAGLGAISAKAQGFAVTRKTDNTTRVFCGNSTKLYEQSGGAWSDKSGSVYSVGVDERWRFVQFGDVTLASAKSATIQAITTSNFADASGTAPKAAIIETINNQVFAFNINGMGFGDQADRWACSALGSYTDWTPSVATQCVSGQFLDSPGGITAGKQLGSIIVAYKERAMYVGQYVGAPEVWNWQRVPGDVGTPVNEAVVNTGTQHFFIGTDDFFMFDGTRPVSLNSPLRQWFFSNLDQKYAYRIQGAYDRINKRAYWWFPTKTSNGSLITCLVYHIQTGQWGKFDQEIEYVADYVSSGITYDSLGSVYSTYNDLPADVSYDSPFWNSGSSVIAIFKTDHKAYQLSGAATAASFTTGHFGDNVNFSTIKRVRPRFLASPTSSTLDHQYSNYDADDFVTGNTSTYDGKYYDLLWSARWHKMKFNFTGPVSISGFDPVFVTDGSE